jgi:hypothetical protein
MSSPSTVTELAQMVNFNETALAVLAVAGVLIALYVTYRGVEFVMWSLHIRSILREGDEEQQERERNRS